MKWMVPVNDLDAVQSRAIENIVDNQDKNHWVKGFAGSGKTIVLTHVLERLASARPAVKVCFATYAHALKDLVESGLSDNAKSKIDVSTFTALKSLRSRYDIVVADEMQDIPSRYLPALASKSDVLIIAADLDQSIFRSACSVSELNAAVKPAKEHQLREIHRRHANLGPRLHADVYWSFQREYGPQQQLHQGLIQQLDQRLLNHEFRRFQRVTKSPPPAEIATE